MFSMTETEKKAKKKIVIETGYQNSSHSHFSSTFSNTLRQLTSFAQESNQSDNSTHTGEGKVQSLNWDLIWVLLQYGLY